MTLKKQSIVSGVLRKPWFALTLVLSFLLTYFTSVSADATYTSETTIPCLVFENQRLEPQSFYDDDRCSFVTSFDLTQFERTPPVVGCSKAVEAFTNEVAEVAVQALPEDQGAYLHQTEKISASDQTTPIYRGYYYSDRSGQTREEFRVYRDRIEYTTSERYRTPRKCENHAQIEQAHAKNFFKPHMQALLDYVVKLCRGSDLAFAQ